MDWAAQQARGQKTVAGSVDSPTLSDASLCLAAGQSNALRKNICRRALSVDSAPMLLNKIFFRQALGTLGASLLALLSHTATAQTPAAADTRIPPAVESALQRAKIPRDAVSLL